MGMECDFDIPLGLVYSKHRIGLSSVLNSTTNFFYWQTSAKCIDTCPYLYKDTGVWKVNSTQITDVIKNGLVLPAVIREFLINSNASL